jgi:hypothetical protein
MFVLTGVASLRSSLSEQSRRRAARRQLERELAEFRTPAERLELDAMIERHLEIEHEVAQFREELPEYAA